MIPTSIRFLLTVGMLRIRNGRTEVSAKNVLLKRISSFVLAVATSSADFYADVQSFLYNVSSGRSYVKDVVFDNNGVIIVRLALDVYAEAYE